MGAIVLASRIFTRSQFNCFLRMSLRCNDSWFSQLSLSPRQCLRKFSKQDERIATLMRIGFSMEEATLYLQKVQKTKTVERRITINSMEKRIKFFRERFFEDSEIKELFKRRKYLFMYSLDRISSAESFLYDELGCNLKEVRRIVTNHPCILIVKREDLLQRLTVLPALLEITPEAFKSNILKDPSIMCVEVRKTKQVIELLKEFQIPVIPAVFFKWPAYFTIRNQRGFNVKEVKKCIQALRVLRFTDDEIRKFVLQGWNLRSLNKERVQGNFSYIKTVLKFSNTDLREFCAKKPWVLTMPTPDLMWKVEYLTNEMGLSEQDIVRSSDMLSFRRKRIKARCEFARMSGKTSNWSTHTIVKNPDEMFAKHYGTTITQYFEFYDMVDMGESS